jgi:hypothetical protein
MEHMENRKLDETMVKVYIDVEIQKTWGNCSENEKDNGVFFCPLRLEVLCRPGSGGFL